MKYLGLILLSVMVISCDEVKPSKEALSKECLPEHNLVGTWEDSGTNQMVFGADCLGTEDNYDIEFTYNRPFLGRILIEVTVDNGGILGLGEHECFLDERVNSSDEPYINLDCGDGANTYVKQ